MALPAYDQCIKASHVFNLLDARGVISVTERQSYILRVRELAKACGEAWLATEGGGSMSEQPEIGGRSRSCSRSRRQELLVVRCGRSKTAAVLRLARTKVTSRPIDGHWPRRLARSALRCKR